MLKRIGYWQQNFKGPYDPPYDWPHPRHLVDEDWEQENRPAMIRYLRSGVVILELLGYSYCRFEPDLDARCMGCRELSDGEWVWPEGLSHYVEKHLVRLPDEFLETMKRNQFQIPADLNFQQLEEEETDFEFWNNWCQNNVNPIDL